VRAESGGSSSAPATGAAGGPVSPQLTPEQQAQLEREATLAIEQAQSRIDAIDATKLDAERTRKLAIAKDMLTDARGAMERKENQRASSLATKARLLAEELLPK
jgi:hypothetical protein